MIVSVSRQPILNADFVIDGFELFSQAETEDASATVYSGADSAICRVLTNAFCGFGAGELTNGSDAYIGFTNNLLLEGLPDLFPPEKFIIEAQPNLFLDETLADCVSALRARGYRLALKSYTPTAERSGNLKYLGMFDVVRIDVARQHRLKVKEFVKILRKYRARILAENVDTPELLAFAREVGFDLFQGKVFGEPSSVERSVSLRDIPYGKLFNHFLTGRVNRDLCGRIILEDPALTHMFLRKVFNSRHNRKAPELEVERGLTKIDDVKLRHWSAVLLLDQAGAAGTEELVPQVFRRGLVMEQLAGAVDLAVPAAKAFMFGVSSALDRVLGEDMQTISSQLALGNSMRDALLSGKDNGYLTLLKAARAYEADPEKPKLPAAFSRLSGDEVARLLWNCQVNTEYITRSLEYTVPTPYKGNVLR
ncbi:MAG: EAL domain-containing protein [Oscillospiraceae bacterium]|nr:EAL domain-containing protein [Oscillospiraceae bacterium]